MELRKRVGLSSGFRKYLRADANKSRLCLSLGISRTTLARWTASSPEELSRMDRAAVASRLTGMPVESLFEMEEETA